MSEIKSKEITSALSNVSEIRKELTEAIADCIFITINDTKVFGKKRIEGGDIIITESVKNAGNIDSTVRNWVKAYNSKSLEKFTVSGDHSLVIKEMSENNKFDIESEILSIARKSSSAVTNLINNSF